VIAYLTLVCVGILVSAAALVVALAVREGQPEHGKRCRCERRTV
jgi:hypothetical protein